MFFTIETMVFFIETIFFGTKTLFSEAETILFAAETNFSSTEKVVGEAPTIFLKHQTNHLEENYHDSTDTNCGRELSLPVLRIWNPAERASHTPRLHDHFYRNGRSIEDLEVVKAVIRSHLLACDFLLAVLARIGAASCIDGNVTDSLHVKRQDDNLCSINSFTLSGEF
jgi:hypothetical protein